MKKTKIVATIGPSIDNDNAIEQLIKEGVNIFRFNFSHGDYDQHKKSLNRVRRISEKLSIPVATLMDLAGPKLRIGMVDNPFNVHKGDTLEIKVGTEIGNRERIYIKYPEIFDSLKEDSIIYLADGTIKLKVIDKRKDLLRVEVLSGGVISSKKGLNFPNLKIKIPAVTEKDIEDIKFGVENGFDFIALSFVKNRFDVIKAKEYIKTYGGDIPVFSKIEKHEAIDNIDEIIEHSDGIMIARGDMGIEIDMEKVPVLQKMLIKKANSAAKPVITATQMLLTMVENIRPTRAEVSDVANAVLDGTDAVMLSDETTIGKYPFEAVKVMSKIIKEAESIYSYNKVLNKNDRDMAIAEASARLAGDINADGIAVFTKSGTTARRVSAARPKCDILAIMTDEKLLRRVNVLWGVTPFMKTEDTKNSDELLDKFLKKAKECLGNDKIFVATIGYPAGKVGSTNAVRIINTSEGLSG
ncbi:pyruvate kinase [Deferribacterales bacterium Es71-Z0220]|jgi:pyruvate kinase|uniref:pyruvate kinase n=1 Tax=Deferrivibrio essentukiensis TaxID=2880922 RepID=UPI001F62247E|nr:pyruvate kinase [Deferrivibrio essentukiensis]MBZ4672763.1 pyruvate kinase [Deferribacteraceae bacterium]MCB4204290.1 pyruvate kinase [Deferrivibrio essentukiensis]